MNSRVQTRGELRLLRPLDVLVLLLVCATALLVLFFPRQNTQELTAVVTINGKTVETIRLTGVKEPYTLELSCEPDIVLLVEPGAVSFQHAGCPDQLCVKTGKLTRAGAAAACVPAKTVVSLHGTGTQDAFTY